MDERIRIEVEVDRAARDALSEIASRRDQPLDELFEEAVLAKIEIEQDFEDGMRAGLADIRAGRTISHGEYLVRAAERRDRWFAQRRA